MLKHPSAYLHPLLTYVEMTITDFAVYAGIKLTFFELLKIVSRGDMGLKYCPVSVYIDVFERCKDMTESELTEEFGDGDDFVNEFVHNIYVVHNVVHNGKIRGKILEVKEITHDVDDADFPVYVVGIQLMKLNIETGIRPVGGKRFDDDEKIRQIENNLLSMSQNMFGRDEKAWVMDVLGSLEKDVGLYVVQNDCRCCS
jgi:hypothetical protein